MQPTIRHLLCLAAAVLLLASAGVQFAYADPLHSVFLTVPNRSEEAFTWCGPAAAQMVMEGYPGGPCVQLQADIWAAILTARVEAGWDTDPAGMRGAIATLCPPPSGGWSVFSRTDATSLMHSVAYYMTSNNYPVALLMNSDTHNAIATHAERWVTVKGIVTDVNPVTNTTVTLHSIWLTDPAVENIGDAATESFFMAEQFYLELKPVGKAASAYVTKFVAVIEPPAVSGFAKPVRFRELNRRITRAEALDIAERTIGAMLSDKIPAFREFRGAKPLDALLVNSKKKPYYLVLFSTDRKTSGLAILIGADTGQLLEATVFAPKRFITEREALERASRLLRLPPGQRPQVQLTRGDEPFTRYRPIWTISTPNRTVLVHQSGEVRVQGPRVR